MGRRIDIKRWGRKRSRGGTDKKWRRRDKGTSRKISGGWAVNSLLGLPGNTWASSVPRPDTTTLLRRRVEPLRWQSPGPRRAHLLERRARRHLRKRSQWPPRPAPGDTSSKLAGLGAESIEAKTHQHGAPYPAPALTSLLGCSFSTSLGHLRPATNGRERCSPTQRAPTRRLPANGATRFNITHRSINNKAR